MIAEHSTYIPVEDFGCFITIKNGVIFEAPIGLEGQPDLAAEEEVKAPSEHFVTRINEKLNTAFKLEDFCGRKRA